MANNNKEIIEYVYNPEKAPDDFQNIAISMEPFGEESKILITITATIEMTNNDVEGILDYLEKTMLKRQRLSIIDDSIVRLEINGVLHEVAFADRKVQNIIPL
ncbi:MAG: hypothetical protein FWG64_07375 [Firmicutes bacterium]|nr:hypothetical protein [Bacillota bacterium]